MYIAASDTSGPLLRTGNASFGQVRERIHYVEVDNVKLTRADGRVAMTFRLIGPMADATRRRFISRFINPILRHDLGRKLLAEVDQGGHPVAIAWGNGRFGFNGTIAHDRRQAIGGNGSGATIFIDERAPDLGRLETLRDNPDALFFHELVHAFHIQSGTNENDEAQMERKVIGLGDYSKWRRTENGYRRAKGIQLRCCRDRETL